MFEGINKVMLAGLGALSMTKERAEKIFDEYVHRGQAAREERQGFVKELMDTTERTRHELEELVNRQVHQAVDKIDIVRRADLARLEAKLDEVISRLHAQT